MVYSNVYNFVNTAELPRVHNRAIGKPVKSTPKEES